ncbi:RICIN domain-containing protein [Streptomyces cyaneofuscatus]|uniref:RICIN domain-containing protein n=1 Tax=Streptomyces cyaneofuscatus TaxID=66883 RepID=UPI003436B97C
MPPISTRSGRRTRWSALLTPIVTSVTALAVLGSLAVQPDELARNASPAMQPGGGNWSEHTPAEQLRQDQCLMSDVLRLGGLAMSDTAQRGLGKTPEQLRVLADRDHWENTPLATAYDKDRAAAKTELDAIAALHNGWKTPLAGLDNPAGFTSTAFHWPPGTSNDGRKDFHSQTGLRGWVADQFWRDEADFYEDPTPAADDATMKSVKELGALLYGGDPDPGLPSDERNRALAERDAYRHLTDWPFEPPSADDARVFLGAGGFPRTAPLPGTAEHRIAVEDVKARFSACAWRDPIDPSGVLGNITGQAAAEWQQEIASQATQRDQIINANRTATKALAAGSKALGQMLGQSWVADHLTRWQDYWSAGGVGWIGSSPTVIQVPGAAGKCLEAAGGGKANGTVVQMYTCNNTAAQQWEVWGDDPGLHLRNVNSGKCLEVASNSTANGAKIQLSTCSSAPAQTWEYNVRATTTLKSVGTGKCLNLPSFTNGQDALTNTCNTTSAQKFTVKVSGHNGPVTPAAQFTKASKSLAAAQAASKTQLAVIKAQATAAANAATTSGTAEKAAYDVADTQGAPRGRGLLVAQQKAQVTQGAAAALAALVKAGETAEAATRAAAGDSATIAQRALAQAAQSKTEFRKEAAYTAELQAKAAMNAAKLHRDNAKKDKETAEAKLAQALTAESGAKAAAADAHAKRLTAEAEEAKAKKEKATAAAKQAETAQHRRTAEAEAVKAEEAKGRAESAETTAVARKGDAQAARDRARDLRDDAWDAEQKADAARARADAKEAFAEARSSESDAGEARAAANAAAGHAADAEAAAGRSRSAADAATRSAAEAEAAATRAEAAAKRSRAAADGAQAAKLKADAAVRTATSAAADAIAASQHAAAEAKLAVEMADEAEAKARTAKGHADVAQTEADKAVVASAKAAGLAHVTARAAVDAGNAAAQVSAPANDAIQLGSPYVTKDSAAGLVVLTGQASKTIAEQQKAVAEAHAKNAAEEAAAAKAIADAAQGDAKAAYQHAANAAGYAAQARGYAKEALGYAAAAAQAAAKAQLSLARTIEYDRQATSDAAAADRAAGRAGDHATEARSSADQAALDAGAARAAAARAEEAAEDARAAAKRADEAATAAEEAAKDAQKYAESAQQAAESAERKAANQQVSSGSSTGVGGSFYVIDKITQAGPAKQLNPCEYVPQGCTVTYELHVDVTISYYYCVNPDVPATASGCPKADTVFLGTETLRDQKNDWTHHFSFGDITRIGWQNLFGETAGAILYELVLGDAARCYHRDGGSCAWVAAMFVPTSVATKLAQAVKLATRAEHAVKTGENAAEVLAELKKIYGEKGALQIGDATSAAGMGLRIALGSAERAKIARGSLDPKLLEKLTESGVKFNKADTIWVASYAKPGVPLAWLEKGNVNAGLVHIVFRHAGEFATAGVRVEDIPALVKAALTQGTRVGTQGTGRPIYEVAFNGKTQRVAVSVGDNGYVIGANPV